MTTLNCYKLMHNGVSFTVKHIHDEDSGPPWAMSDGHGVISNWEYRSAESHEWILCQDGRQARFYDVDASIAKALAEGWDAPPYGGTDQERATRAVKADFAFLRGWCLDEWQYIGIEVCVESEPDVSEALWGIESNAGEYLDTVARELADEILMRYRPTVRVDQQDLIDVVNFAWGGWSAKRQWVREHWRPDQVQSMRELKELRNVLRRVGAVAYRIDVYKNRWR